MKKLFLLLLFVSGFAQAGAHAFYDFSSHSYLVENNRHEVRSIASITKLFTAITVLNSGVDLNEKIKVNGRSRGHVPSGVLMTRMDLMRAMLISSDNRAAETLANHHPGGFDQFIREANSYVDSKALYNTKIVDSTGLLPGNQSTATELIEFLSLIKNQPIIRKIASERNAALNAPRGKKTITINVHNTNPEIFVYDNILISKTGFTNPAGRCVLMLIEKKKELYGVVVLGQSNVRNRSILVKELLAIEPEPQPELIINSTVEFEYSNPL
jgi:D-alanyl-D-alanine endopeptidase (penicillin-binding protein 7)